MLTLSAPPLDPVPRPNRVEIIGVFGAGKSTLAKRIAGPGTKYLAEDHQANPYWGCQKAVQVAGYLPYDLSFLMQHALLVATAPNDVLAVCDWSFLTDRLWAKMRLAEAELTAYDLTCAAILTRLGSPQLYIYLRQSPDVIRYRVAKRARQSEEAFCEHVEAAYARVEELVEAVPAGRLRIVGDAFEARDLMASLPT